MARPGVQFLLLLLAIPAQYYISSFWSTENSDATSIKVRKLVTTFQDFSKKWLNPKTWLEELKKLWFYFTDKRGECVAVEIMEHRSKEGYFANSPQPRHERAANIKYRVGQVFLHQSEGYHGVIVGWDKVALAPDHWLEDHYGYRATERRDEPHYAVLPDAMESPVVLTYVSQDEIEIVTGRKIVNDIIDDYFQSFDGEVYQTRPFLRQLYPKD